MLTPAAIQPAAVYVAIGELKPWIGNPRKNDPAVQAVVDSIRRFGFGSPILARKANGEVIAGHTRLKAAIKLGLVEVPVRYLDLTETEAHALALADNRVGEIAEWDDAALAEILRELDDLDVSLDGLGWTGDEMGDLLGENDLPDDGDDVPEVPAEAASRRGEVYALGPHRLACGDSTDAPTWAALLGGEKAQMIWTDPPYGVAYVGKTKDALTIENDSLPPDELATFLMGTFTIVLANSCDGAAWYVAAPAGPLFGQFGLVLTGLDVWRHTIIWVKDQFVLGRCDYHYRHEAIFYGWTPGAAHYFVDDRTQDSVIECPRPKVSEDHPTMKPVELVRRCVENSSKPGWLVADPFGGSGTTLLACAASGRIARLIELSPPYCDVIRRRWTRWALANNQDPGFGALDG